MRFPIYSLCYGAALVSVGPFFLLAGRRRGKYAWNLAERLGRRLPPLPPGHGPRTWVHALSLGEVNAAEPLVRRLAALGDVCLSTTTRSGWEQAVRRLDGIPLFSMPLDWPPALARVRRAVSPELLVIVETDLWPNLAAHFSDHGTPVVLVNARLSPRSYKGYRRFGRRGARMFRLLAAVGCQTAMDRDRFLRLGLDPGRVYVTGNLKFDRPAPEDPAAVRAAVMAGAGLPEGLWVFGGSTHDGEEEILLPIFERLLKRRPELRLFLAPRDTGRSEAVWRLIRETGLPASRRTTGRAGPDTRIFLLDTLGELDRFYAAADLVFIGKSLTPKGEGGGQNPVEPALRGKAVLFGPRMHNFREAAGLLTESGGGLRVDSPGDLETALDRLTGDPALMRRLGAKAREAVAAHRGALDRTMGLIARVRKAAA